MIIVYSTLDIGLNLKLFVFQVSVREDFRQVRSFSFHVLARMSVYCLHMTEG